MPTDDAASDPTSPAADAAPDATTDLGSASTGLGGRLAVLDRLAERPLQEHVDVYHGLHTDLQGALAEIDSA